MKDPWEVLRVIPRIDVGPTRVETRRLVTPYRVSLPDRVEETNLIYTFEESVFHPREPDSLNLASMIGAQVALNYGLFAEEIVFHGPFDKHDRRFLRDMAENSAREITVIKFLHPNPFLRGPAATLPPIRRERYCHARLRFEHPGEEKQGSGSPGRPWSADPASHAILSSGGKESLLTHGILREMGKACYPGSWIAPRSWRRFVRRWAVAASAKSRARHFIRLPVVQPLGLSPLTTMR